MEFDIYKIIITAFLTSAAEGNGFITMSQISQDMENILYSVKSPTITNCHILCSKESNCETIAVNKDSDESPLYNCYLIKKKDDTPKKATNEVKNVDGCQKRTKESKPEPKVGCFDDQTSGVKIPKEMVGKWKLKYTIPHEDSYSIEADGLVTIGSKKRTQKFERSDNQDRFPSKKCWFLLRNLHRAATWEYLRLGSDGLLEIQHFCTDSHHCKKILKGVGHYCCPASGIKEGGSPLTINRVEIPIEMVGEWTITYTTGAKAEYAISADRLVTYKSNGMIQSFKRSDNQDKFPSSQGWFLLRNLHKGTEWEYVRLGSDGLLEIQYFCSDGCKSAVDGVRYDVCAGSGRKEGGSPLEMNRMDIPKEMVGKWSIAYTSGHGAEYEISADRLVTFTGNGMIQSFKRSDNQDKFPSSQGWFLLRNLHRAASWEYVRLGSDGLLEIQHFCNDNCNNVLNGIRHYCCSGTGRK